MLLSMSPSRTALCILAVLSTLMIQAQALSMGYCSSQNTGVADSEASHTWNSWSTCSNQCSGYAFAILQFQSCWCSDYAPPFSDSFSSCSDGCPGYPDNSCGNTDDGLYTYLSLGPLPLGTAGQYSTSLASSTEKPTTSTLQPSLTQTTQSTTHTYSVSTTVQTVTTKSSTSVPVTTQPSTSVSVETLTRTPSSMPQSPSTITLTRPATTIVITTSPSSTSKQTPTPLSSSGDGSQNSQKSGGQSLSDGATAGVVIAALAGLAALAGALFYLLRRRHRDDGSPGSRSPRRTTSVLSRTGLLSRGRQSMMEQPADESVYTGGTGPNSIRHSILFGGAATGAAAGQGAGRGAGTLGSSGSNDNNNPQSSTGNLYDIAAAGGLDRRPSRPLVYDQRLNPSALFANHDNGSRVSMQDNNDYSRPLGIANPDLRPSFESRRSNWD